MTAQRDSIKKKSEKNSHDFIVMLKRKPDAVKDCKSQNSYFDTGLSVFVHSKLIGGFSGRGHPRVNKAAWTTKSKSRVVFGHWCNFRVRLL